VPTYKNKSNKPIYANREYIFPVNEEVIVPVFLPVNSDIELVSETPYPESNIILSKDITGDIEIEVPADSAISKYTVIIVGEGGVISVSLGDPTKYYAVSSNSVFMQSYSWCLAPKIKIKNKFGAFKGVITITK
jgi:predicted membrane protein